MEKILISFYTLGCKLNQSETAVLENLFTKDIKYKVVSFEKSADIVIINTCTVTEKGDTDTRKLVNKARRINPDVKIALIGCQAQTQKEDLAPLPNVKWIVGTEKKMDLLSILSSARGPQKNQIISPPISKNSFTMPASGITEERTRANIKIQDGCDFFCSYCEVPYARGQSRSREFRDIIKEAKELANAGRKEIVITGVNIGTYKYKNYNLTDLITALDQVDKLKRIRISSLEFTTFSNDLLKLFTKKTKLCRHLHIPLQSASDPVLKAMNRKYTYAEFNNFINLAHDTVKDLCIGTDVIVGFPSESEEYFSETFDNLKKSKINYFHVFSYSKRTKAKSKTMQETVPINTIQKRSQLIRALGIKKRNDFLKLFIGRKQKVLFEQKKKDIWSGFTDNYIRVTAESDKDIANKICSVRLLKIENQKIFGEILK